MTGGAIKGWFLVHKWAGLACTLFALLLCLTGLPLIFHDEIDRAFATDRLPAVAADTPRPSLDAVVRAAQALYPGERPLFVSWDEDRPVANVTTAPAAQPGRGGYHLTAMDLRTARKVAELEQGGFMQVMLRLHVDLFADLPGKLFLGFMGFLFLLATVSGVVLYGPFMRKLAFGTLRWSRGRRVRWLDAHNLVGIVTLAWVSVVAVTGVVNTRSEPLVAVWRVDQLAALTRPYAGQAPVPRDEWGPLDAAVAAARMAAPGTTPQFVAFPGTRFSSEHHYAVWLRDATPATHRLLTPALIDVRTGRLTAMAQMPWYMLALRLSQPLHFGDYAGLPLKLLWALLDMGAILILGSGAYLWLGRRTGPAAARLREIRSGAVLTETA